MSYCRFGEQGSDIYAYPTGGGWVICGGGLWTGESWETDSLIEFRDQMRTLVYEGYWIPPGVFERIDAELRGEDPYGESFRAAFAALSALNEISEEEARRRLGEAGL